MNYVLEITASTLGWIVLWMIYVHIYGISLSLYREGKGKEHIPQKITGLKNGVIVWGLLYIEAMLICPFYPEYEDLISFLAFIILQGFFYCAAEEKKLRTSFWVYVVSFTMTVPFVLFESIVKVVGADINLEHNSVYDVVSYFFLFLLAIGFYFLDRKTNFAKRVQKKEKFLLFTIVAFVVFIGVIGFAEDYQVEIAGSKVLALTVYLSLSVFSFAMVVRLIAVGTESDRYEELSIIHEKNARETLAFYESYKEAQTETRKLRHDMRNHFSCIQMLAKEKKYEEMEKYLENFNESVAGISMEFQTGNDIVDAILNVKHNTAKKKEIEICVEGNIPRMTFVDSMDWCRIFSNAIDNGIEALENLPKDKRILKILLKSNGHFFVIHIENPCENQVNVTGNRVFTSKAETYRHGFGLKNMETALKKYGGELKLTCTKRDGGYVFVADMIMPEQ